jgi:hypothetical protein
MNTKILKFWLTKEQDLRISVYCGVKGYGIALYHDTSFKPNGKAIPLQAWPGPKGSRRLRLPDFKTVGT